MFQGSDRVECENCGALLPAADADGTRTCTFCKAVYQSRPAPSSGPAAAPVVFQSADFQPINAGAASTGCGLGAVILTLVILASVLLPLYFAFRGTEWFSNAFSGLDIPGVTTGSGLDVRENFVVLPAEPSAAPPVVALTTHYDSARSASVEQVVRVDGGGTTPAWTSADLATTSGHPMALDATHVYVGDGSKVLALNLTDGKTAWQVSLSDKLTTTSIDKGTLGPCGGCFTVAAGNLVTKTDNGVIAAFDAASGAPTWSKRLADVNAKVLRVGERLVVIDGTGGDYTAAVVDPASGADAVPPLAPVCARPGSSASFAGKLGFTSVATPAPDGSAVTFVFGTGTTCVQRWDVNTGQMVWNAPVPDKLSFSSPSGALDAGGVFAVSSTKDVLALDAATGTPRAVVAVEDADVVPAGVSGPILILRGESTRGTRKHQLWGLNLDAGAVAWTSNLDNAASIDPPADSPSSSVSSSEARYTMGIEGTVIHLLRFDGGIKRLSVENLDATTGSSSGTTALPGEISDLIPSFGPASWQGSRVTVIAGDHLVTVQTAGTPAVISRFPS